MSEFILVVLTDLNRAFLPEGYVAALPTCLHIILQPARGVDGSLSPRSDPGLAPESHLSGLLLKDDVQRSELFCSYKSY